MVANAVIVHLLPSTFHSVPRGSVQVLQSLAEEINFNIYRSY